MHCIPYPAAAIGGLSGYAGVKMEQKLAAMALLLVQAL